ncbi:hypothetical protein ACF0H5_009907 [Mactra antiquata]
MLDDLMRQADETKEMLLKAMAAQKANAYIIDAVVGDIDMVCPSPSKVVRIFTSSTFTDTKQERNMLMKYAYPRIKEHCRKIGYEFQVVDMRWGVRDEATDDHMGTELCLKELRLCQQLSTGPNFVSLLSHKYGYTAFPRLIDAEEFEKIFDNIKDQDVKDLFQKWYTRDDNYVPPTYILASISTHIPDFICNDTERKKVAKNQWWEECQKMQDTLEETAKLVFDEETSRKYIMSVTETEVQEGVLKVNNINDNKCIWLKRNIEDITQQESSYALSRFMECLGSDEKVQKARMMLKDLTENKMMSKLDKDKILNYNVHWNTDGGINPDGSKEHRDYLEKLCDDFINHMIGMIDKSVAEKKKKENPLIDECLQHIRFAQTKCEGFAGQKDTLDKIKGYLTSTAKGKPLILYGSSGTGKTSIMAMAAKLAKTWMPKRPVVILRFLGTSPDSSNLMSLLYSISSQIKRAFRLPPKNRVQDIKAQILDFKASLAKGRATVPVVLILDSLDQLDPDYDARKLTWLNIILPSCVKIIVSTLPEPEYECFPALKDFHKEEDKYIEVPVLLNDDVKLILNNWLQGRKRKLTEFQMKTILDAFKKCPTPLFLKLSFEESTTWTSHLSEDKTILQHTVRASIDYLFQKLEKLHGKILVSRALAYLTLANNGATEAELEDILSCDDDVLNDVYMYWMPPIRRLPPLLMVRIRTDLDQYLVERGADGVRVLYWYHRQFTEAALARYCSDAEENKLRHQHLADFFQGRWAGTKKPYTNAKGEHLEEDRQVSAQPLKFGDNEYNIRALNNLPYHRIHGEQGKLLEEQCLSNVDFLINKLEAVGLTPVLDDFKLSRAIFSNQPLIARIHDALLLSQKGLITDPGQLTPQLLGRLDEDEITKEFLNQCKSYGRLYIEPSTSILDKPGGQLVHCISAHKTDIDMMDMTADGRYVLTVCQCEHEIKIWDLQTAQLKRTTTNTGQATLAYFCMNDTRIIYERESALVLEEVETGVKKRIMPVATKTNQATFCVAGKGKSLCLLFFKFVCTVFDLSDENSKGKLVMHPEKPKFGAMSIPRGSENFVAVCTDDQYHITVLDLQTMTYMKMFRGFEKVKVEDGDDDEYDEHEVEDMAIDPTETFLVYTTLFTSEVVFADFEGNKLRSIPANADRSFQSVSFSPDGQYIYLKDSQDLIFYDTTTLEEVDKLEHSKDVISAKTVDMITVCTVADDSNLRIWDRTRPKQTNSTSTSTNNLSSIGDVSSVFALSSTKYVAVRSKDDNASCKIGVYDVLKEKYVRMATVNVSSSIMKPIDATRVFMMIDRRKAYIVNLKTMTHVELVGVLSRYLTDFKFIAPNKLLTVTKGSMNLRVHDIDTGKVLYILKAGQQQRLESFEINETGTMAVAKADEGPLILFDLKNQKHMYNIENTLYDTTFFGCYTWINNTGTRLVFNIDKPLPELGAKSDDIDHAVMWDIENRKELFRIYDLEYQKNYSAIKHEDSTSMEAIEVLDENRLIFPSYDNILRIEDSTSMEAIEVLDENRLIFPSYDNILRIYDVNNGKLLNRLIGHTTTVKLALEPTSPYILSYGCTDEEDCIRLWDKQSGQLVASYSLDKTTTNLHWINGGEYFVTTTSGKICQTTYWKIHHSQYSLSSDIPDLYDELPEFTEPLVLKRAKMEGKYAVNEPGDPDDDQEIYSGDDDDDDGNDD